MRLAVMQPYFFPYIGYFQLISAVDKFVFYDDVNFIKGGWINRNRMMISGKASYFTIPLLKQSSFDKINETRINFREFQKWKTKYLRSLEQNYSKSPYFELIYPIIFQVINSSLDRSISELSINSILSICKYLSLEIDWTVSSQRFSELQNLERSSRLIEMARSLDCTIYINASGGKELYNSNDFKKEGIELKFLRTEPVTYKQFNNEFVPNLSIIDLLMFNSVEDAKLLLSRYSLEK